MFIKQIALSAAACVLTSVACAAQPPSILVCKIEQVTLGHAKPGQEEAMRNIFGVKEGDVLRFPVSKLEASGDTYVMHGLKVTWDTVTISRTAGTVTYSEGLFGTATGTCDAEQTKF